MLYAKKLIAKILQYLLQYSIVKSASIKLSYKDGNTNAFFYKQGKVVNFISTVDWKNLPAGFSVNIGTIPEGFRPAHLVQLNEATLGRKTLFLYANGSINVYNYDSQATAANGRYQCCYITQD